VKRQSKIFLVLGLAGSVIVIFIIMLLINRNHHIGKIEEFELEIGQTITVTFAENSSTGYTNCWINQEKCHVVKLVDQHYKSSLSEMFGGIGSGGSISWTFQATESGTDTIKISDCATLRMQKDCDFFSGDSLRLQSDNGIVSEYAPYREADHYIIFTVVK